VEQLLDERPALDPRRHLRVGGDHRDHGATCAWSFMPAPP
jgi:hypothetical protein